MIILFFCGETYFTNPKNIINQPPLLYFLPFRGIFFISISFSSILNFSENSEKSWEKKGKCCHRGRALSLLFFELRNEKSNKNRKWIIEDLNSSPLYLQSKTLTALLMRLIPEYFFFRIYLSLEIYRWNIFPIFLRSFSQKFEKATFLEKLEWK